MKKLLKIWTAMAVIALTASCGGGDENAGTPPFGTGSGSGGSTGDTGTPAADLIVTLSTAQLPNTGSATADISVTAIDASRNAISGVPVTISADGNAVVTVSGHQDRNRRNDHREGLDGLGPRQSRDHCHRDLGVDLAVGDAPGRWDHHHQRPRAGCHCPLDRGPSSVSRRRPGRQSDDRPGGADRRALA